ncbi:MAG: hypothetical protein ABL921_21360 [Pirellula sp.]
MRIYVKNETVYPAHFVRSDGVSYRHRIESSTVYVSLAERGRVHWLRFHTMEFTPDSLASWEAEIPSFGCDCAAKYSAIKNRNPPRFEDSKRWRWEIHNAVNTALEKPLFPWSEYVEKYGAT